MQSFIFSSHSLSMASVILFPLISFFIYIKNRNKVDLITTHENYGRRVLKCKDESARILQQYRVAAWKYIYTERESS